jgi:ribonuclease HI
MKQSRRTRRKGQNPRKREAVAVAAAPREPEGISLAAAAPVEVDAELAKARAKARRKEPFAIMDSLSEMSAWARSIARDHSMKQARQLISDAFEQGKWVAASDASIDALGRGAMAWAIFSPDKKLAASGESIAGPGEASSTSAEAVAALRACEELDRLGAHAALCVCDCVPAIQKLLGLGKKGPESPQARRWAAASKERFKMSWVPREALGPANDAARALLSLRAEMGSERPWSTWAQSMSAPREDSSFERRPKPGRQPDPRKALGERALAATDEALRDNAWIAVSSAWLGSDGRRVGIGVAIFDPSGRLVEQSSRLVRLDCERDMEEGHRQAALVAAKRLAHWEAPSALCLCGVRSLGESGAQGAPSSAQQLLRWFGESGPYRLERAPADALGISATVARGQSTGWSGVEERLSPAWRESQWAAWMAALRGAAPEMVAELAKVPSKRRM